MKIVPITVEKGEAAFELTIEEAHLRTMGIATPRRGGHTPRLRARLCVLDMAPAGYHVVTVQLNINYIRPAWLGEKLIARSDVRHAGQMTAVSRGEVRTVDGALARRRHRHLYVPANSQRSKNRHGKT